MTIDRIFLFLSLWGDCNTNFCFFTYSLLPRVPETDMSNWVILESTDGFMARAFYWSKLQGRLDYTINHSNRFRSIIFDFYVYVFLNGISLDPFHNWSNKNGTLSSFLPWHSTHWFHCNGGFVRFRSSPQELLQREPFQLWKAWNRSNIGTWSLGTMFFYLRPTWWVRLSRAPGISTTPKETGQDEDISVTKKRSLEDSSAQITRSSWILTWLCQRFWVWEWDKVGQSQRDSPSLSVENIGTRPRIIGSMELFGTWLGTGLKCNG